MSSAQLLKDFRFRHFSERPKKSENLKMSHYDIVITSAVYVPYRLFLRATSQTLLKNIKVTEAVKVGEREISQKSPPVF